MRTLRKDGGKAKSRTDGAGRRDEWEDGYKVQTLALVYPLIQTERNRTTERPFFTAIPDILSCLYTSDARSAFSE